MDKTILKVITYIIRGLNETKKRARLLREFQQNKGDIMFLQETFLQGAELDLFRIQCRGTLFATSYSSFSRGVATIFHQGLRAEVLKAMIDQEGRYVLLVIKLDDLVI